ncbi:MAG: hypothetical protein IK055_01680, partial [Lachnospiraceae bacterium]|nr:hypothetical protein [Lachnospiraceae bacterium]
TLKIMTHMGILSDRQITLYRIHAQKRLCKRNFYFSGKHVEIKNSLYGPFFAKIINNCKINVNCIDNRDAGWLNRENAIYIEARRALKGK